MSSANESERSKPPSPKRPKLEDQSSNDGTDSDGWESDDLRLFDEEWKKSEGFDVDLSKLRHTFGAGSVDLNDDDMLIEPETNREFLNRMSMMTISFHKENTGTSLEFVEVLRANHHGSAGVTLYVTFEAKDPSDGYQKKQYRAVVRYLPGDIEVYSCNPRPC